MKKIYVIVACNNEQYEDYCESDLGFVESEQKAKEIIDVLNRIQKEDFKTVTELESRCECCDGRVEECPKCSVENEVTRIEHKDMYYSCHGRLGDVIYSYIELKEMF